MKCCFLTFRSVTYAQRTQRLLQDRGVRCLLQRTPRWMEEQGCGYAVKLWSDQMEELLALLKARGLSPRKIYQVTESGMEEVAP